MVYVNFIVNGEQKQSGGTAVWDLKESWRLKSMNKKHIINLNTEIR